MRKTAALLLLLGTAFSGSIVSAEIYKWTDADGNVHYGDRPTADGITVPPSVERVAVASRRTNPERVEAGVDARLETDAGRAEAREAALKEKEAAQKQKAEAEDRVAKCNTYRERLEKFVTSRRLYRLDDNGERQYLDEGQMDAARARVQQQVEEYCSS